MNETPFSNIFIEKGVSLYRERFGIVKFSLSVPEQRIFQNTPNAKLKFL